MSRYTHTVHFSQRFFDIKDVFTGKDGGPFFNNITFRRHLNKYFKVGRSLVVDRGLPTCHWMFKLNNNTIIDSIEDGVQPENDYHCTLFSLYTELNLFRPGSLGELIIIRTDEDYIQNLIVLYDMLLYIFQDEHIKDKILSFKSWKQRRPNRDWIELNNYPELIEIQIADLRRHINNT